MSNQPTQKVKVGNVTATVWKNQSQIDDGDYNVIELTRSYKDKSGEWQTTKSFRVSDLPKVEVAVRKVFENIMMQE